jgi:hypothetical protein
MDKELLQKQIETVFSRQSGLSDTKKQMVKEKLATLDWDKFKEAVLARYYEAVEKADKDVSPELANSLLMEAIRLEIEDSFGKPGSDD